MDGGSTECEWEQVVRFGNMTVRPRHVVWSGVQLAMYVDKALDQESDVILLIHVHSRDNSTLLA